MKYFFKVLLTPSCWFRLRPYSKEWDAHLNKLLFSEKFTDINSRTAKIGGIEVWIANHPYASMSPNQGPEVLPKRATVFAAYDKLSHDRFNP